MTDRSLGSSPRTGSSGDRPVNPRPEAAIRADLAKQLNALWGRIPTWVGGNGLCKRSEQP